MRMRPDILVVGEVRGEEAYVLFQAISTGHGGLCTLHADDAQSAIQRLVSKPMDVPEAFIPFLNLAITVRRLTLPAKGGGNRIVRRIMSIDEVNGVGDYFEAFTYDPILDRLVPGPLKKSRRLAKLAKDLGLTFDEVEREIDRRSVVLQWMQHGGIRNFKDITSYLQQYVENPTVLHERAKDEMGLPAPVAEQSGSVKI